MASIEYNISIVRGSRFEMPLKLKASDVYLDLTAYTPKAQIRDRYSGDLVAEFVCIKDVATAGLLYLTLASPYSQTIPMQSNDPDIPEIYVWGLVLINALGESTPMLYGKAYVYNGVVG